MVEYFHKKIEKNEVNESLINEIEEYVSQIIYGDIPNIPYSDYVNFYENGVRQDFEKHYFEKRKQLTALGLYLMWNNSKLAVDYFKELLWSISNEFSWCLVPHLKYDENGFNENCDKIIDLFSAETAESLSEILVIHKDKIDKNLANHIKNRIKERVLDPFINEKWTWEEATHNWSAVCGGCVGISALILEKGKRQKLILDRVDKAMEFYLSGFGNDGATLEGIGYWFYGFGYYIYYKDLKKQILGIDDKEIEKEKIKTIGNFPEAIQIAENKFLTFSDVPQRMELPSGLISYLFENYKINLPSINRISSLYFDHCYRWAHVSRNLWWTNNEVFNKRLEAKHKFFENADWLIYRKDKIFIALKGGCNDEPHNHNDVGSFVVAVNGEIILTDLGAGTYTSGYFGNERYEYPQTRSYWHSVPIIDNWEQEVTKEKAVIKNKHIDKNGFNISLELSSAYKSSNLVDFERNFNFDSLNKVLILKDFIVSTKSCVLNEGFVSMIKPKLINDGLVRIRTLNGVIQLNYDYENFDCHIESKKITNHYGNLVKVYRVSLKSKIKDQKTCSFIGKLKIECL